MSTEGITVKDRLLYDVELALGQTLEIEPPLSIPAGMLAGRGTAGVTSLYIESFLAIDQLPKAFNRDKRRLGRTALTGEAEALLCTVDQSIELNPFFDYHVYTNAKYHLNYQKSETPMNGYLTNHNAQEYFAERGLAAMHNAVEVGLSRRKPPAAWRPYIPAQLLRTMRLNGSMDLEVISALEIARKEGGYTIPDYVEGLIGLARETSDAIIDEAKTMDAPPPRVRVSPLRKAAGEGAKLGTYATVLTAIGEGALIIAGGHPSLLVPIGAFATAAVGRKRLHSSST